MEVNHNLVFSQFEASQLYSQYSTSLTVFGIHNADAVYCIRNIMFLNYWTMCLFLDKNASIKSKEMKLETKAGLWLNEWDVCVSVCREDHQGLRILSDYLLYCQREHGRHRRSWTCLDNLSAKVEIKANNRPCRSLPQSCRTSLFTIPQVNTHQHNNEHAHTYT